jgi:hypothetical protein
MVRKLVVCLAIIATLMVPAVTWAATPSYISVHDLPTDATRQAHWEYNPQPRSPTTEIRTSSRTEALS